MEIPYRFCKRILLLLSLGSAVAVAPHAWGVDAQVPRTASKALCGPRDRTETGLQGQTTLAERFNPTPTKAYNCNLELIGQFEGEGAGFVMDVWRDCAYYATWPNPRLQRPGVVVLDISDPRLPRATAYLDTPTMRDVGEGLVVAPATKLLLGSERSASPQAALEIYDLSRDCRRPILKTAGLPGLFLHTGQFTSDGGTFYGAKSSPDPEAPVSGVFALDVGNPSNPLVVATWVPPHKEWNTHAVSINREETRAYVAMLRHQDDMEKSRLANGLVILDISDIKWRRNHPQFRVVSSAFWDDAHFAQFPIPLTVKGRSYLIFTDLMGALGGTRPVHKELCDLGKAAHGFARMIDVSDDKRPKIVSKLMLEVHDPANCSKVKHDPTTTYGYGSLACDVDDANNAKLVACAYYEAGLRVFDIRDPMRPREVAYYKPPARRTDNRPGSILRLQTTPPADLTTDQVVVPKFLRGGREIAFISFDNGFQVVRFADRFIEANKDLFEN